MHIPRENKIGTATTSKLVFHFTSNLILNRLRKTIKKRFEKWGNFVYLFCFYYVFSFFLGGCFLHFWICFILLFFLLVISFVLLPVVGWSKTSVMIDPPKQKKRKLNTRIDKKGAPPHGGSPIGNVHVQKWMQI